MPRLSDMMKPEDWAKAKERYQKRIERREDTKVSPEIYLTAEFGYYFGWAGIMAILSNQITLDKAYVLLEGARKVWYQKIVEQASANQVSFGTALSKHPKANLEKGMRPFVKRSEIDE